MFHILRQTVYMLLNFGHWYTCRSNYIPNQVSMFSFIWTFGRDSRRCVSHHLQTLRKRFHSIPESPDNPNLYIYKVVVLVFSMSSKIGKISFSSCSYTLKILPVYRLNLFHLYFDPSLSMLLLREVETRCLSYWCFLHIINDHKA
jgi:hypothetical protein